LLMIFFFFFQAEDGIRDFHVTGVQTCALPISMISVHFCENEVIDFDSAAQGNNDTFKKFFHAMLNEGVYIAPSAFETWFLTDALSYEDLDKTIAASEKAIKIL